MSKKSSIKVSNIKQNLQSSNSMEDVSAVLDWQPKHFIPNSPWANQFPYQPEVRFSIAYANNFIYLKYYVSEKYIRVIQTESNGAVYEDSCVEFFVSFDESTYYNLECNCLGTFLIGFKDENGKQRLSNDLISQIETQTKIHKNIKNNTFDWTILWKVPTSVFAFHPNLSLSELKCRANFYKCGDKLPEPHFLCWSNIEFEKPNFHLPQFFGELIFDAD